MITIFIPTPLRRFAAEQAKVNVNAKNVAEAIRSLTSIHPSLTPYIYDEAEPVSYTHLDVYKRQDLMIHHS